MTPLEIKNAILGRINDNWSTTDVAWPNNDYDPNPTVAWIRPTISLGTTYEGEKGATGLGLRTGALIIQIFVPLNTGVNTALGYAGTLETLFRKVEVLEIIFGEAQTKEVDNTAQKESASNNFYQVNVIVPFYAWVGE